MIRACFADTSAWFAALDPREARHELSQGAFARLLRAGSQVVTTNLVLAELHPLIARSRGSAKAVGVLDQAYADPAFRVVHVQADLQSAAVDHWLRVYRDVPFSLCDAVSFEVMQREGIRQAFTLDRHFAVAGFTMVPTLPKPRKKRS